MLVGSGQERAVSWPAPVRSGPVSVYTHAVPFGRGNPLSGGASSNYIQTTIFTDLPATDGAAVLIESLEPMTREGRLQTTRSADGAAVQGSLPHGGGTYTHAVPFGHSDPLSGGVVQDSYPDYHSSCHQSGSWS